MKITVIGAGMSGLLAAAMLRSECEAVIEAQPELPNNHSALLRFRSSIVGDSLGIEFNKVQVLKSVVPWRNPVADALAYANKCTGEHTLRSSLSAKSEMEERYVAPHDLIHQMQARVSGTIFFNKKFAFEKNTSGHNPIISTIPMPMLMGILEWTEKPNFRYVHGCNINATLAGVNAYCTLYVPNPEIAYNRISVTGNKLTIEFSQHRTEQIETNKQVWVESALNALGIENVTAINADVKDQKYAKILPIDDDTRKRFMMWATQHFNIYSLGRFATWRPGVLMDDVVNDVRVIRRLINRGHIYDQRKS